MIDRETAIHELAHVAVIVGTPGIDTDVVLMDDGNHINVVTSSVVPQQVLARAALVAAFTGAVYRRMAAGATMADLYNWFAAAQGSVQRLGVLNDPAVSDFDRDLIATIPDLDACAAEIDRAVRLAQKYLANPQLLDDVAAALERHGRVALSFRHATVVATQERMTLQ